MTMLTTRSFSEEMKMETEAVTQAPSVNLLLPILLGLSVAFVELAKGCIRLIMRKRAHKEGGPTILAHFSPEIEERLTGICEGIKTTIELCRQTRDDVKDIRTIVDRRDPEGQLLIYRRANTATPMHLSVIP
jgi:hypothetical protein